MHPTIRPDLRDACLEDRILPAYSANIPGTILTTGGYVVLTTPPGLSSALSNPNAAAAGNSSGAAGGQGGNMSTSFNISGFGPSQLSIGNVTGYPALAGGKGGVSGSVSLPTTVGSGANDPNGSSSAPVSRFVFASGGALTDPGGNDFLYIGQNFGGTSTGSTQGTSQNGTNTGATPAPQDNTPPPPPAPLPGAVPNNLAPPPTGVNTGTGVTGVKM